MGGWLNDSVLRQAEQNVQSSQWTNTPYKLLSGPGGPSHQCQDYADRVEAEYDSLTGRWVKRPRGTRIERVGWRKQWRQKPQN